MPPRISAIVLNYKHPSDTIKCIRAIKRNQSNYHVDYYIVDNSPKIVIKKRFKKHFPDINYISSPTNPGFAAGNNLAIRQALQKNSQFILIINPDATIQPHFFDILLKHFSDKRVGVVAPAILHHQKGKSVYGLDGEVDWLFAKPTHRNLTKIISKTPITSKFVTFACVIISADTFHQAGLLDEGYFMYFEDVDYCLSATRAGKKIILDPKAVVLHNTSSSFKHPTQKLSISLRSHLRFINKWLPLPYRIVPFLYAVVNYPYLYLLWTYHELKYQKP